ncbi:MAG: squalene/phytoene synthase family protein [Methylophilaceae bacterium]
MNYTMLKKSLTEKSYHENFPVATLFLRKNERNDILVLYQFARECDDIADNENFKVDQRKKILDEYQKNIKELFTKNDKPKLFINLQQVSIKYNLNINLFKNFMRGFYQDLSKTRYKSFDEIIQYCHLLACPAGEMVLTIFNKNTKKNISLSNNICIALAMIGMVQDIQKDYKKGRVYIPLNYFKKFNLKEEDIQHHNFNNHWELFKIEWLGLIKNYLNKGKPLIKNLDGRLKFQIKLLLLACDLLIKKLSYKQNLFINAPRLSKLDWSLLGIRALLSYEL